MVLYEFYFLSRVVGWTRRPLKSFRGTATQTVTTNGNVAFAGSFAGGASITYNAGPMTFTVPAGDWLITVNVGYERTAMWKKL